MSIGQTLLVPLMLGLAGCAGMTGLDGQGGFSCKAPDGISCASLSGVYANAVQNKLPGQTIGFRIPFGQECLSQDFSESHHSPSPDTDGTERADDPGGRVGNIAPLGGDARSICRDCPPVGGD